MPERHSRRGRSVELWLRGVALIAPLQLAVALSVPGCDDDENSTGRLRLLLGDAPFPVDMVRSAEITVESVAVRVQGDDGDRWESVPWPGGSFDLLELQNGITAELATFDLPAGQVDQIRLVILSGRIELEDDRSFDLTIPSGMTSGLKIVPSPAIVVAGGLTTDVLLDVDLARSFQAIPAAPGKVEEIRAFHFHPVLRVANLSSTGSIAGFVLSREDITLDDDDVPLAGVSVLAYRAAHGLGASPGDSATATTATNGLYRVLGLGPGTWTIVARPEGYLADSVAVEVVPGNETVAEDLRLVPSP